MGVFTMWERIARRFRRQVKRRRQFKLTEEIALRDPEMLGWQMEFLAVVAQAESRDRATHAATSSAASGSVSASSPPYSRHASAASEATSASPSVTSAMASPPTPATPQSGRAGGALMQVATGISLSPAAATAAQLSDPAYELFAVVGAPPGAKPPSGQSKGTPRRGGGTLAWMEKPVLLSAFAPGKTFNSTGRIHAYGTNDGDGVRGANLRRVLKNLPEMVMPAGARCSALPGAQGSPLLAGALDDMAMRKGALESTEGAYLLRFQPGAQMGGRRPFWVVCLAADELLDAPPLLCEDSDGFRREAATGAARMAGGRQRRFVVTRRVYCFLTRQALFTTTWNVLHALAERQRLRCLGALCGGKVAGIAPPDDTLRAYHKLRVPLRGEIGHFKDSGAELRVPRADVPTEHGDSAAHAVLERGAGGLPLQDGMPPRRWAQEAEEASAIATWAIPALCATLSVDNCLLLMSAALLEYPVVLTHKNLGVLTASVLALAPLLWPLLPMSNLVPIVGPGFERRVQKGRTHGFVVGMPDEKRAGKATGVDKDRLVICDLSANKVKAPGMLPTLPGATALAAALHGSHQILWDEGRVVTREGLPAESGGGGGMFGIGLRRPVSFAGSSESSTYMSRAPPSRPLHSVTAAQATAANQFLGVMREYIGALMTHVEAHVITQSVTAPDGAIERLRLFLEGAMVEGVSGDKRNKEWMEQLAQTNLLTAFVRAHKPNHLDILGRTLLQLPSLSGLSFQSIQQILDALHSVKLRKGKHVFRQGDPSDGVYFVTRGELGVYVAKPNGDDGKLKLPGDRVAGLGQGAFFGEMATDTGRTASIIVESPRCELMKLDKDDWDAILIRDSDFAEKVSTTAEGRKTENAMHNAARIVAVCPLFSQGDEGSEVAVALFPRMQLRSYRPGEYIVRRGDIGREMFFCYDGTAEVLLPSKAGKTLRSSRRSAPATIPEDASVRSSGARAHERGGASRSGVVRLKLGDFFGEGALIETHSKRNADVRAGERGVQVLVLNEDDFSHVMANFPDTLRAIRRTATTRQASTLFLTRGVAQLLRECPFMQHHPQLCDELFAELALETMDPGEVVVRRGDRGDSMYFIHSGSAIVQLHDADPGKSMARSGSDSAITDGEGQKILRTGDYFGEMALLNPDSLRVATVVTGDEGCQLLRLDRDEWQEAVQRHPAALEEVQVVAGERMAEIRALSRRASEPLRPPSASGDITGT